MTEPTNNSGPRIFIEVWHPLDNGQYALSRKEISALEYANARYQGTLAASAINTALAELGYRM